MITKDLILFIKKSRADGHTNEDMKAALVGNGWLQSDVEEAFAQINLASNPPAHAATPTPVTTPPVTIFTGKVTPPVSVSALGATHIPTENIATTPPVVQATPPPAIKITNPTPIIKPINVPTERAQPYMPPLTKPVMTAPVSTAMSGAAPSPQNSTPPPMSFSGVSTYPTANNSAPSMQQVATVSAARPVTPPPAQSPQPSMVVPPPISSTIDYPRQPFANSMASAVNMNRASMTTSTPKSHTGLILSMFGFLVVAALGMGAYVFKDSLYTLPVIGQFFPHEEVMVLYPETPSEPLNPMPTDTSVIPGDTTMNGAIPLPTDAANPTMPVSSPVPITQAPVTQPTAPVPTGPGCTLLAQTTDTATGEFSSQLTSATSLSLKIKDSNLVKISGYKGMPNQITWTTTNPTGIAIDVNKGSYVRIRGNALGSAVVRATDTAAGPDCSVLVSVRVTQ